MSNARKPRRQLSSCFIDTVPEDSLEGILRSVDDFAQVSKFGGGRWGPGHVRAAGGSIRGFEGVAGGVVVVRVVDDTAVAVDQLAYSRARGGLPRRRRIATCPSS